MLNIEPYNNDIITLCKSLSVKRLYLVGSAVRPDFDEEKSDVVESILNAIAIYKKIRSTSTKKLTNKEFLYIILSTNLDGIPIYTKGKLVREKGQDTYYFLVSSKKAL